MKIVFAPGSFDDFEGTQEELDEFIKEIQEMCENGQLFEESVPIDFDQMMEEDPELYEQLVLQLEKIKELEDGVHFAQDKKKLN